MAVVYSRLDDELSTNDALEMLNNVDATRLSTVPANTHPHYNCVCAVDDWVAVADGYRWHKTSTDVKNQLDTAISRFFYGSNISFAVADHELFQKMIATLRPGYQAPSRKALADKLLDNVSTEMQTTMQKELEHKEVTLIEDGWSNVHNDPVTASCVHVNGKSFFVKATDNGSAKKTAQYCKDQCEATIQEVEQKYGCKVCSIVTDNEKKMERMKKKLQQDDDQLIVYGCSSHWLNLLGQQLTPSLIMKHVVEVNKYFRNHHQPAAWLKEVSDTVKPQLPGETRMEQSAYLY